MATPPINASSRARRGSVLLMVLVVVAMLTLGTATYLELMQTERLAVRHHGRAAQARRLAESGVEYVKTRLALPPAELLQEGGLAANPTMMQAVLIDDQPDDFDRGRVTVVAPAQIDGYYAGIRYGLENESAKLNLNVLLAEGAEDQAAARLLALPGMTGEIADAILDWIDSDEAPRVNGAEQEYYSQLTPSYAPRNAPLAGLDELLLVRGVTPELLYGVDQNRNMLVDAGEQPRGILAELDNTNGVLNRGWAAYLTTSSIEAMRTNDGANLIDLNGQNLQQLYTALGQGLDDAQAKFIIVFRQHGPQPATTVSDANGATAPAGDTNPRTGGESPGASAGPDAAQTPTAVDAASIQLNFEQEAGNTINSPLDLIGAKVQIPGSGDNAPTQLVESPWRDEAASYRELLALYDMAGVGAARRVAGRVNLNAAARPVLRGVPDLSAAAIDQIVSRREIEPDPLLSEQRHAIWLLVEGVATLEEMKKIERFVTSRGDVFSGQSVGYYDAGPAAARGEFILDRTGTSPRLRGWRDLTPLGRGFTAETLGAEPAPSR